jgi:hypothetical protein
LPLILIPFYFEANLLIFKYEFLKGTGCLLSGQDSNLFRLYHKESALLLLNLGEVIPTNGLLTIVSQR